MILCHGFVLKSFFLISLSYRFPILKYYILTVNSQFVIDMRRTIMIETQNLKNGKLIKQSNMYVVIKRLDLKY